MLSKELEITLNDALLGARSKRHEFMTVEHLLFAMMCEENFFKTLQGFGADVEYLKSNLEHHLKKNCHRRRTCIL